MSPREGRISVTLPRLLRERLHATIAARGWLTATGQPERGAETEILTEWLMDYARLRGWSEAGGSASADPPAEDDFGFRE